MGANPNNPQMPPPASATALLSRSTILILSGFLIGMGFGQGFALPARTYALCAGGVGLAAYLAFEQLSRRQQTKAVKRARQRASRVIERRMQRHIITDIPDARNAERDALLQPAVFVAGLHANGAGCLPSAWSLSDQPTGRRR